MAARSKKIPGRRCKVFLMVEKVLVSGLFCTSSGELFPTGTKIIDRGGFQSYFFAIIQSFYDRTSRILSAVNRKSDD